MGTSAHSVGKHENLSHDLYHSQQEPGLAMHACLASCREERGSLVETRRLPRLGGKVGAWGDRGGHLVPPFYEKQEPHSLNTNSRD